MNDSLRIRLRFRAVLACGALLLSGFLAAGEEAKAIPFRLANASIAAEWQERAGHIENLTIVDAARGTRYHAGAPFALLLRDGTILSSETLTVAGEPVVRDLTPNPGASRLAERLPGREIAFTLESADHALTVRWSVILLKDARYVREVVELTAVGRDVPVERVQLVDLPLEGAAVAGLVKGSPIVAGPLYLGFENPLAESRVTRGRATAWLERELPLRAGQTVTYSAVFGVARDGQLRRDFLAYLENERAHPYRTFLHYNSWYDLGYFEPYDETGAVDRIHAFGEELTRKRGVKLDSFLFDDGWDNHHTLWKFNEGFPEGFAPLKKAAAEADAHPGVWMSPWGGYSKPKQERIAFGAANGYEIVDGGYALSGPRYYAAFRDVCLEMIRRYGVNQFKFDGTGNVDSVVKGSEFDSDFAAAIHLIGELRAAQPDLFVNLTTGTWPSPFWTRYADSIWRGGDDDNVAGVGSYRERWITYRDGDTYQRVVQGGPLYPLNSLMLHGLILAQHHRNLDKDPGNDFRNEVRSYFGTGTQLQEMYITPSLLSASNWDDVAEAAKWSRANADVLKDTHWVGGDPAWLEVYGWASWAPRKGILVLRNPSDKPQTIRLKLSSVFELPADAAHRFEAHSPWKDDAGKPAVTMDADEAHAFELAPFEVLTLEMAPKGN